MSDCECFVCAKFFRKWKKKKMDLKLSCQHQLPLLLTCTPPPRPPFTLHLNPSIKLLFTRTYFYLSKSLIICENLFKTFLPVRIFSFCKNLFKSLLFMWIFLNLFLFMIICENLLNLFLFILMIFCLFCMFLFHAFYFEFFSFYVWVFSYWKKCP